MIDLKEIGHWLGLTFEADYCDEVLNELRERMWNLMAVSAVLKPKEAVSLCNWS